MSNKRRRQTDFVEVETTQDGVACGQLAKTAHDLVMWRGGGVHPSWFATLTLNFCHFHKQAEKISGFHIGDAQCF